MNYRLIHADVREALRGFADESFQCCVTSPPYFGLRNYGVDGQLGLERTPDEYVATMVDVFRGVRRTLRSDGTLWLNLGDSYAGGGNGGGGSFAKDGIRCAEPGTDKNKATRFGPRGAVDGIKAKDLIGIPWMLAFALRADGWYLRADIIWSKPNPMPESVTDRPTKAHEYLFLLSKSRTYYYDAEAIKEPATYGVPNAPNAIASPYGQGFSRRARASHEGLSVVREPDVPSVPRGEADDGNRRADKQRGHSRRHAGFNDRWEQQCSGTRNKRSVWTIATEPFPEAHFATYPTALVEPCILAGSRVGDTILDPFNGSGTTGIVALSHQRNYVGIDLNADYLSMARRRLESVAPLLAYEVQG